MNHKKIYLMSAFDFDLPHTPKTKFGIQMEIVNLLNSFRCVLKQMAGH